MLILVRNISIYQYCYTISEINLQINVNTTPFPLYNVEKFRWNLTGENKIVLRRMGDSFQYFFLL